MENSVQYSPEQFSHKRDRTKSTMCMSLAARTCWHSHGEDQPTIFRYTDRYSVGGRISVHVSALVSRTSPVNCPDSGLLTSAVRDKEYTHTKFQHTKN